VTQAKASFYFNVADRDLALCQLVGKACRQGLAVGILTQAEADSQRLDRLLWEVPATGFVPHCLADSPVAAETPVLLDHRSAALQHCDVLFNCSAADLPGGMRVKRLVEIVARDDEDGRIEARSRVRRYQQAGFEIDFTDMAKLHG
jgi:DNA polymerase-3 subunit chi